MSKKAETKPEDVIPAETKSAELPATVKIKFNKNVRYNRTSYVKDDKIDVPVADYEQMTEHCEIVESAE